MAERIAKKRRLVHKLAEIGIGSSSVIAIINALREEPELLEDGLSRRDLERGIMAIFAQVAVSIQLPRHTPGQSFVWEFASFQKLLAFTVLIVPCFARWLRGCTFTAPAVLINRGR
jgi:hypothetical protein